MTDLHTALEAAITARLKVARAVCAATWGAAQYVVMDEHRIDDSGRLLDYLALHDPDDAVRRYEADLTRLAEHEPSEVHSGVVHRPWCQACDTWAADCVERRRLLVVYPEVMR